MANWTIKNVALRGVTGTVPSHSVKTSDFPFFTQKEADTFDATVGIKNRYIASDDTCSSDLCLDAAERLIDKLGWEKESIDILFFVSVTGDYKTPPTSPILQDRLGLPASTFVLDIPMGCCGCIYGINLAGNLLSSGSTKRALVLVGDTAGTEFDGADQHLLSFTGQFIGVRDQGAARCGGRFFRGLFCRCSFLCRRGCRGLRGRFGRRLLCGLFRRFLLFGFLLFFGSHKVLFRGSLLCGLCRFHRPAVRLRGGVFRPAAGETQNEEARKQHRQQVGCGVPFHKKAPYDATCIPKAFVFYDVLAP